jgi:hypothetical protein
MDEKFKVAGSEKSKPQILVKMKRNTGSYTARRLFSGEYQSILF